ncbi:MAG: zinc transporter ZupT [Clostridiales bacterium]|jgi:ZIP family zinc transporter|nr:zinc transporter ZupT [Clostridiales bacterium]
MGNVSLAFLLTLIAGMSTGIGSLIAFFPKTDNKRFLAVCLGFSAGVMIYISMMEIFFKAKDALSGIFGEKTGMLITILAFFGGMLVIGVIDKLIPDKASPPDAQIIHTRQGEKTKTRLMRTGLFVALAISIHNIPEGLAVFVSALQEPSVAIPIIAAVAIHNIPEGIAVAVPIYYATGSRKIALSLSFLSGLAEPIGALIGYLLLLPIMSDTVYGILFAAVAGIMVFISFDELLPSARVYGEHKLSIYGLISGMALMAVSLWMFI